MTTKWLHALPSRTRGRTCFEISEWDHWDTGQHRIGLLAEIPDELVFSRVGWVPTPAGGGPPALPQRTAGQNFKLCSVVPYCSYFLMDVGWWWSHEKAVLESAETKTKAGSEGVMSVGKMATNGIQQHLVLSHSMQQMVCKNPDFHSLHLYPPNNMWRSFCHRHLIKNLREACRHILCNFWEVYLCSNSEEVNSKDFYTATFSGNNVLIG